MRLDGGAGKISSVDIYDPGPSRLRLSISVTDAAVNLVDEFFPNYALVAACVWQREDHRGLRMSWLESARKATISLASGNMKMSFSSNIIGMDLDVDPDGDCKLVVAVACESKHCRRAVDMIHRALSISVSLDESGDDIVDLGEDGIDEAGRMSGDELRAMRERAGLTRGDLADMVDLSTKTIQRYEAGMRRIPRDLADVFLAKLSADSV